MSSIHAIKQPVCIKKSRKNMSDNHFSEQVQAPLEQDQLRQYTLIVYILYIASIVVGLTSIVAIIMNYIKRDEVKGTWLESHFSWQIKTFWYTLVIGLIGSLLTVVLIGFPILLAVGIWYIYRVVKGLIVFLDNKTIADGLF